MIKALFTALTGIDESIDNDDYQDAWQRQKFLDENDLDENDLDVDDDDDDDDEEDEEDDDETNE